MEDLAPRVDLLIRGGAVAALAICALISVMHRDIRIQNLAVPALCVGLGAYLLVSSPNVGLAGTRSETLLVMLASLVPVLAVWTGAEIFLDRPVYKPWHGIAAAAVVAGAWMAPLFPWAATIRGVLVVLLYGALLYIALSTAADDLVETRRQFRRWFVVLMAVTGLGISLVELLHLDANLPAILFPLHALLFLMLVTLFLVWAARIAPDIWSTREEPEDRPVAQLSAADEAVLRRINAEIAEGIWRTEGLTIAQLAAAVEAPEHRVRRAINKGLGYRNFAQFVNERRIGAARELLADPARSDTPVLSIAYDVGFASVGPFNRAFRDATGQSPTEFRKAQEAVKDG